MATTTQPGDGTRHYWNSELRKFTLAPPKKRAVREYVPPILLPWFTAAACLPGKALLVACAVRRQSALRHSHTVTLHSPLLSSWKVGPIALRHALLVLETAGLISVERKPGTKPRITIIERDAEAVDNE
jgi:hypothetical protein